MASPVFRASAADATATPIEFDVERPDGKVEHFVVPRPIPALPVMELAAADDANSDQEVLAAFVRFIRACIPPGDYRRFADTITKARFTAEDVLPIVRHIITESSGRPSTPPSPSPASPSPPGTPGTPAGAAPTSFASPSGGC